MNWRKMHILTIKIGQVYHFKNIVVHKKTYSELHGEVMEIYYDKVGLKLYGLPKNRYSKTGVYWYTCDELIQYSAVEITDEYAISSLKNAHNAIVGKIEVETKIDEEKIEVETKIDEEKGENAMILEIYNKKQTKKIKKETTQKRNEAIKSDKEYNHLAELSAKYGFDMPSTDLFEGLQEKLDAIKVEEDIKLSNLSDLINEVSAQLELCENYDQKVAVLKNYDILDKDGKVKGE